MNKLFSILGAAFITVGVFAQSPEKMAYQAVIRDTESKLVTNMAVSIRISIVLGSANGQIVYTETQTPLTNANGLISIEIGGGTGFDTINWTNGMYFIRTETDPTGSTNYNITGTSQLLSVPYSLHAKTAERITGSITETDPLFGASVSKGITTTDTAGWNHKLNSYSETQSLSNVIAINDSANSQIKNLTNPTDDNDAATKAYVDNMKREIKLELYAEYGLSDIDGNHYNAVKIGSQVWMKENLKVTKYRNGEIIGTTTPSNLDVSSENAPKYQWAYAGIESYVPTYGRLYTWYTVTDSRNVCPNGWHLPTDSEITIMEDYLIAHGYNYDGTTIDNKIAKSMAATTNWAASATVGSAGNSLATNNSTGFTSLPAGYRQIDGTFISLGYIGYFWSTSEISINNAYYRHLYYQNIFITRNFGSKKYGFSVRCLKD